jgi:hypothetical protein
LMICHKFHKLRALLHCLPIESFIKHFSLFVCYSTD